MSHHHPVEPTSRHVWVRASGGHGPPTAGVVITWQPTQPHSTILSPWVALVATTPFDDLLCMEWVMADRLIQLADPSPADVSS